jgi:lipid-binding SYLF domain-containing protein
MVPKPPATGLCLLLLALLASTTLTGCSTAPRASDQPAVLAASRNATTYFTANVPGLRDQLARSGGYAVFPDITQWGIVYTGGRFGRGAVFDPAGEQIGWAAVSTPSLGLQVGVQGFRMIVVFEDDQRLEEFKEGELSGTVNAVAVAGRGGSGTIPFDDGLAVYQGANKGLMLGVSVGLDALRYRDIDAPPPPAERRADAR